MSNVATYWLLSVPTDAVINTDYVITVGETVYSFFIISHCFLPSVRARPFMSPFQFSFRNINDATTSALYLLVSLVVSTGAKDYRTCSCVSYFVTDASPCSLYFIKPVFIAYCFMMMWIMKNYRSPSVIFSLAPSMFRWMCRMSLALPSRVGINLVTCFLVPVG